MKLYHGSNVPIDAIDLSRCRPNKDFGQGFYLSPDKSAAEKMAHRTVKRFGGVPHVMANRKPNGEESDHNRDNRYGMVSGPIANDDLALLFRQFLRGLLTVEMLMREMQFKVLTIQYSFHTPEAVSALKFMEVERVG